MSTDTACVVEICPACENPPACRAAGGCKYGFDSSNLGDCLTCAHATKPPSNPICQACAATGSRWADALDMDREPSYPQRSKVPDWVWKLSDASNILA